MVAILDNFRPFGEQSTLDEAISAPVDGWERGVTFLAEDFRRHQLGIRCSEDRPCVLVVKERKEPARRAVLTHVYPYISIEVKYVCDFLGWKTT